VGGQRRQRQIKGPMLDQVIAAGQVNPADMDPDSRDTFVELEQASRTRLESYGASSRGGRPNGPDEDAFYSASMGFHPGEIGGTEDIHVDVPQRERRLAEVLGIPVAQIRETHAQIQRLMQEGRLGGIDVVADGMGHHGYGEYASSIATFIFVREIAFQLQAGEEPTEERIQDAVLAADKAVDKYNEKYHESTPKDLRPGTTFVAQVTDKNGETIVASIGDARAYKKDNNGNVVRLTSDDSVVEGFAQVGNITPSDVLAHLRKSTITNALQNGNNTRRSVHTARTRLAPNEQLLLVCDGVWEGVTHDTLVALDSRVVNTISGPRKRYDIDLANYSRTQFSDERAQRAEYSRIRQEALADICGDINQEYRDAVAAQTSPQEAMNIAQGKMFQRLILRGTGIDHLEMRGLARELASLALGLASGDNVTAVVVENPLYDPSELSAYTQKPGRESEHVESRADIAGDHPTPGVAKMLLGAIDSEQYNPDTVVTGADRRRLRKQLNRVKDVKVEASVWEKVLKAQGTDAGNLQQRVAEETKRIEGVIQNAMKIFRMRGEITMSNVEQSLRNNIEPKLTAGDRDLVYMAMAKAILSLPRDEKRRWLDMVIKAGTQPLSNDRELFQRLYDNEQQIGQQLTKAGTTRRRFLWRGSLAVSAAVTAASAVGYARFSGSSGSSPESPPPGGSPVPYESETEVPSTERFTKPFAGKEANEVAQDLDINAGSFWAFTPNALTPNASTSKDSTPNPLAPPSDPTNAIFENIAQTAGVNGFLADKKLLPLFPAAVAAQEAVLEQAANKVGVPVNVLATITTMESAGQIDASSSADAYGMTQVVPGYHLDTIVAVAQEHGVDVSKAAAGLLEWNKLVKAQDTQGAVAFGNQFSDAINALYNPAVAAEVGALVLQGCYHDVLQDNPGIDSNNPVAWALALADYNGGGSNAFESHYSKDPIQSQLYQVHALRFFMTAEIAARLRNRNMDDDTIAQSLISLETDARAAAYSKAVTYELGKGNTFADISSYQALWNALSQQPISAQGDPGLTATLEDAYTAYLQTPFYTDPVSPGLRIWIVNGGYGQFSKVTSPAKSNNLDPKNYPGYKK